MKNYKIKGHIQFKLLEKDALCLLSQCHEYLKHNDILKPVMLQNIEQVLKRLDKDSELEQHEQIKAVILESMFTNLIVWHDLEVNLRSEELEIKFIEFESLPDGVLENLKQ